MLQCESWSVAPSCSKKQRKSDFALIQFETCSSKDIIDSSLHTRNWQKWGLLILFLSHLSILKKWYLQSVIKLPYVFSLFRLTSMNGYTHCDASKSLIWLINYCIRLNFKHWTVWNLGAKKKARGCFLFVQQAWRVAVFSLIGVVGEPAVSLHPVHANPG